MLRSRVRSSLTTMALGGIVAACGSSNDIAGSGSEGTGGVFAFPSGGAFSQGGGGGANPGGGAGGLPGTGGTLGGTGGTSSGGSSGTSGSGGAGAGGAAPRDAGNPDGSGDDGAVPEAGAGGSRGSGGGVSTGGGGGAASGDAAAPYCGNGIVDGTDKCDKGAVDTATCDADCTLPACGDKHLNVLAGEFCDDGNKTNGDGCDSTCQVENTCPAPAPIPLTDNPSVPGAVTGSVQGDTSDSTSHVNPALCDGAASGAGPDALYSFTLDRTRNVKVSFTGTFDAILRAYTKACIPGASLSEQGGGDGCVNAAVGNESFAFPRLAAGTYYIVVDGAKVADKGTYTLDVDATCDGSDDLRIVELGIGTTDYAVIRNMSDCPADLGGAKLRFDDSVQPDVTTSLPAITLAPGEQLRVQENLGASVPGAVDAGGSIPFQYDRGGTVLLCKSDCAIASSVVDVVQFADGELSTVEPPPPPPSPLTFAFPLTGIGVGNQNTKSWVRVGNTGKNPTFTGADFCTGTPNVPFGLRLEEVFIGDPDFVAMKNHADCAVGVAPFHVRFETGGVTAKLDAVLDSRTLASGASVYLSEPPNKVNDVNTGAPIPNAGGVSGTVRLCLGSCATTGTTIDVIAWDGVLAGGGTPTSFPALPSPLSFGPAGLSGITDANQQTASYRRAAFAGNNSRFFATDWSTGTKSR